MEDKTPKQIVEDLARQGITTDESWAIGYLEEVNNTERESYEQAVYDEEYKYGR